MSKLALLTAAILAAGQGAYAQPAPRVGGLIRQIPPAPAAPRSIPEMRIERGQPPVAAEPGGARFAVSTLHVTGATKFPETELIAAAGFRPGVELDLAGLRQMASRISDFYNRHGYFVAQAYLPAQSIADGAVTIAVIEGVYGQVSLDNRTNVSNQLAHSVLDGLHTGDIVASAPLERRLLLLSDLPGVAVRSTLTPGAAVGASDLTVQMLPGRRISGDIEADNAGNRYTGAYRAGGLVNFNEPFGLGDVASLRGLTSGEGLNYLRGAYQAQVQNATLGVAYEHLWYKLGKEFAPLDAHGTLGIASVYGSYPLIRSYDTNLRVLGDVAAKIFKDKFGAAGLTSDKRAQVASLGLDGDHSDHLWGGGWTHFSLYGSAGDLDIRTPAVRAIDAATAQTQGSFGTLYGDVSRLQHVSGPLSLYGEARGQLASKNLDPSEKMELGGAYGVRAYPEGEAYGDEGYILTGEGRVKVAPLSRALHGEVEAFGFVDHGAIRVNKSPWIAGDNHRSLSAAGLGLSWAGPSDIRVKVSYGFKLGGERAISAPDRSGRLWVQIAKFF